VSNGLSAKINSIRIILSVFQVIFQFFKLIGRVTFMPENSIPAGCPAASGLLQAEAAASR
jgi:hypothetical protein